MYRTYLNSSLEREELKARNRCAPKNVRYCNGLCQDYLSKSQFSGTKVVKTICNKCRNTINLGKKQIKSSTITLNEFKENPSIVYGIDIEITSYKKCSSCHEKKPITQYYHTKGKCKACIAIQNSNRNKKDIETYIKDIETLKTSFIELERFVKNIPKDKLIRIISHFQVGRKSSDTKARMVYNVVEHFKRLANPFICMGGCGYTLQTEFAICDGCKKKKTVEIQRQRVNPINFEDNIDEIIESLTIIDDHVYNKSQVYKIAKKLGLPARQPMKKKVIVDMITEFLETREEEEKEEEKKLLTVPDEKCTPLELNGFMISAREKDGFINATQMCKAGGKKFNHWKCLESTKELIEVLKTEMGIPVSGKEKHFAKAGIPALALIESKKGGNDRKNMGSWIHPDLAVQLAQWISPLFAIQVSRWVREIAITGSISTDKTRTNNQLLKLQNMVRAEREQNKKLEQKHKAILYKRSYHKFKKGPILYIFSDGDESSIKYKVGIDVDINVRLQQHRTSIPGLQLEYLVYVHKNSLIESSVLERYKNRRKRYLNHEWIFDTELSHIVNSITTLLQFLDIEHTVAENIEAYNKS